MTDVVLAFSVQENTNTRYLGRTWNSAIGVEVSQRWRLDVGEVDHLELVWEAQLFQKKDDLVETSLLGQCGQASKGRLLTDTFHGFGPAISLGPMYTMFSPMHG